MSTLHGSHTHDTTTSLYPKMVVFYARPGPAAEGQPRSEPALANAVHSMRAAYDRPSCLFAAPNSASDKCPWLRQAISLSSSIIIWAPADAGAADTGAADTDADGELAAACGGKEPLAPGLQGTQQFRTVSSSAPNGLPSRNRQFISPVRTHLAQHTVHVWKERFST